MLLLHIARTKHHQCSVDLDAWINEPPEETIEESEEEEQASKSSARSSPRRQLPVTFTNERHPTEKPVYEPSPEEIRKVCSIQLSTNVIMQSQAREARLAEIENNPYYMKSKASPTPPSQGTIFSFKHKHRNTLQSHPIPRQCDRLSTAQMSQNRLRRSSELRLIAFKQVQSHCRGVRGLADFERQRQSTLNWKKTKKSKEGKTKKKRKHKQGSDSEEEAVMHQVSAHKGSFFSHEQLLIDHRR